MVILAMGAVLADEVVIDQNTIDDYNEVCGTWRVNFTTTESEVKNATVTIGGTQVYHAANTSANQTSWSIQVVTTSGTDSNNATLNVTVTDVAGTVTGNSSFQIRLDNTGPSLTWHSTNTDDNEYSYSEDFYIRVTANEQMMGAPTVDFKGQEFTLKNSSLFDWYYDFEENDIRDDSYTYTITGGSDNTTCANTGSNTLTRDVNIYSKSSVAAKEAYKEQQEQDVVVPDKEDDNGDVVKIIIIGAAIYIFIRMRKKGRKR
jgi:hypothetical protein